MCELSPHRTRVHTKYLKTALTFTEIQSPIPYYPSSTIDLFGCIVLSDASHYKTGLVWWTWTPEKEMKFHISISSCKTWRLICSSITRSSSCHICQTSCLRWGMTSLPLWDQHANTPGAEPEVLWGRNLPTAPLGFPELQRPKWTAGQLSLGTGARPDIQPNEQSARRDTDKTLQPHTEEHWQRPTLGFPGLLVSSRAKLGGSKGS